MFHLFELVVSSFLGWFHVLDAVFHSAVSRFGDDFFHGHDLVALKKDRNLYRLGWPISFVVVYHYQYKVDIRNRVGVLYVVVQFVLPGVLWPITFQATQGIALLFQSLWITQPTDNLP